MVKNIGLIESILCSIEDLQEVTEELNEFFRNKKFSIFFRLLKTYEILVKEIKHSILILSEKEPFFEKINYGIVENIEYSLENIQKYSKAKSDKTFMKLKFEILPLLRFLYILVYYFGYIESDKTKINQFYEDKFKDELVFANVLNSITNDVYKYDISFVILAYNKLEYTKLCVESFMKNIDDNIDYELILVNHGSSDGTKEYFDSIGVVKQIDFRNNGLGSWLMPLITEGRYYCVISNDVIVGQNALKNMLDCIKSDYTIKYVVPTTTSISNLQSIPCQINSLEEIYKFAEKNNIKNSYRWEQRTRLINPIMLLEMKNYIEDNIFWEYFKGIKCTGFNDDMMSLIFRRQGKKNILAKDSFCYHFGSITLGEDKAYNSSQNFNKGRKIFKNRFGIDPWGIGFCYDYNLFEYLKCNDSESINVLGINCGIGSNPLKIKEQIKENAHNLDVKIYNLTDDKSYIQDLEGTSDFVKFISNEYDISKSYQDVFFKYIIFESNMEYYNMNTLIPILANQLVEGGILCIRDINYKGAKKIESALYENSYWYIKRKTN